MKASSLNVARRFRNLRRLQQILTVLARHGFGDLIARVRLDALLRGARRPAEDVSAARRHPSVEERIRLICESLGPTFVKLGQVMATRPDLVPPSLVVELSKLHDEVPPFPDEEARAVIEAELSRPLSEVFAHLSETPIAAASIAQVHEATLTDGQPVVVKVQRPHLSELIETDLDILAGLAELLEEHVEEARALRPRLVVDEFGNAMRQEIDFRREVENMQRFRRLFEGREEQNIVVPRAFPELCTSRVITMERMEGFKLTDKAALARSGLDPLTLARAGLDVMIESIFEHGFFHADPHPGNILVGPDGRLCLLDFGLMGELDPHRGEELLSFLLAVLLNDVDMLVSQLQEMEILDETRDPRRLRGELARILERFQGVALGDVDVTDVVARVLSVVQREEVRLPADLLLVMKAVGIVEGIATDICPELRPLDEIRPRLVSIYTRRVLDPRQQSRVLARLLADTLSLLRTFPRDLRTVMRRLSRGELRLEVRTADLEESMARRDRAANRIVLALVVVTSMVLSTVLLYYPPGGRGASPPLAAYLGYGVTAVLLAVLVWSVLRSRGL